MKILVIGASKGIGFNLVQQAVEGKHDVTALSRSVGKLDEYSNEIKLVNGSITSKETVETAVKGKDAVCIAIGLPPQFKEVNVFSNGVLNVIDAMKRHNVNKLICVTGIGAGDSKNHGGFFYDKIFNPLLLKRIYEDKDRQEAIVKGTDLK